MPGFLRNLLTVRFSLRALLVVVTIGCLALGWRANRYSQIQRAIHSLNHQALRVKKSHEPDREVGLDFAFFGNLEVEEIDLLSQDRYPSNPATRDYQPANRIWSDLGKFHPLRRVVFRGVDFPAGNEKDARLRLNEVNHVQLSLCKFPSGGLSFSLERFPQLQSLNIGCCSFDSRELSALAHCKQMETLELRENSLAADVMASIGPTPLRRLKMSAAAVALRVELSEKDVEAIVSMPQLEELEILAMPGFPVSLLPQLKQCKNLKKLTLNLRNISEADLRAAKADLGQGLPRCAMQLFSFPD